MTLNLATEKDPEILRKAALLLERENERLVARIVDLTRRLQKLEGNEEAGQLSLEIAKLEQQLSKARQMLFAPSSEKRPTADSEPKAEGKKPHTGHGPRKQPALPVVPHVHDLDEADKTCTQCGGQLEPWEGQFEESEEVDVIERRFVIRKHKNKKYRCKCGACIETAPARRTLIPGGRYSMVFAIEVAVGKYLDHQPLERQVRTMGREGLVVDSQTLWDQINALARYLEDAWKRLREYVHSQGVLFIDETRWPLFRMGNDRKNQTWQVWTIAVPDAVYYEIQNSRGQEAAKTMLETYSGVAMCDGLEVYDCVRRKLPQIQLARCWAHVRREFTDIETFFPIEVKEILDLIGALYEVERQCPTGPPGDEERRRARDEKSRTIVDDIQKWAVRTVPKYFAESGIVKAIKYMAGIWSDLTRFLDDPRIPLDNNLAERVQRGLVVGRKNHYGSRSVRGTQVAALFYSLQESAKLAGIDPKKYLRVAAEAALRNEVIPLPHELRGIELSERYTDTSAADLCALAEVLAATSELATN